jgi:hypothetical protein
VENAKPKGRNPTKSKARDQEAEQELGAKPPQRTRSFHCRRTRQTHFVPSAKRTYARRLRCVELEAPVDTYAAGRCSPRYTGAGRTRRRPQPIPCTRERLRGREHVVILGPLQHLYIHTLPRADVQYGRRGVPGVDGSEDVHVDR